MPEIITIGDQIHWSYANLARAHSALEEGAIKYKQVHHIIRSRLFSGLQSGKMNIGSMFDDERVKMQMPRCCVYCGSSADLSLDHLIPRSCLGRNNADNLILACRQCNSSKGARDLISWSDKTGHFPPIFVLRRFLKLVYEECKTRGILDSALATSGELGLPFSVELLPTANFPLLDKLSLWVKPTQEESA